MKASFIACLAIFCLFVAAHQQTVGGYTPLTPKQVYKNSAARNALNIGAKLALGKAVRNGVIDYDCYKITRILSAAFQVVEGTNYRFRVRLSNASGKVLIARYVVYRSLGGQYSLTSSSIKC